MVFAEVGVVSLKSKLKINNLGEEVVLWSDVEWAVLDCLKVIDKTAKKLERKKSARGVCTGLEVSRALLVGFFGVGKKEKVKKGE